MVQRENRKAIGKECTAPVCRICLVMHSFGGGAEKVALLLARELVLRGWAVSIACLRKSSELARHVPLGVQLFMPEEPGRLASLRFLGRLWTIVRQSSVIVGTLELQSLFVAALLAPGRSIGWLHKDLQGYFATRSRLFVRLYNLNSRIEIVDRLVKQHDFLRN